MLFKRAALYQMSQDTLACQNKTKSIKVINKIYLEDMLPQFETLYRILCYIYFQKESKNDIDYNFYFLLASLNIYFFFIML